MSIQIDKEFESLIPPLSPEEFTQLEENCTKEGIRDALITWNGILIDGHNRFRIAAKHGLRWAEKKMFFADRDEVKRWIILNQFGRRNLSAYDRSVLALKLKPVIAGQAKKNQIASGGAVPQKSAKPIDTREELSKVAGVSHDTIHKVEAIQNSGDQKLIDDVRSGETSINRAYQVVRGTEIKPKTPAQAKREHLEAVQEQHEQFQQTKVVSMTDIARDKENRKTLAREQYGFLLTIGKKIEEVSIKMETGDVDIKAMSKELNHEERSLLLNLIGAWRQELTKIAQEVAQD